MSESGTDRLLTVLERARSHGAFGPGPLEAHIRHAEGFVDVAVAVLGRPPRRVVDLGSGGGVPGLVLAGRWPEAAVVLVDANQRRVDDLHWAVGELGWIDRVQVRVGRAETLAQEPELREAAELVTARGLAPPATTVELTTGFVGVGGWAVVSEPPGGDGTRWPDAGLDRFGFGPAALRAVDGRSYVALEKRRPADAGVPQTTRRLVKRPAW